MLIQQGNVAQLDGKPWAGLEITSELRIEEVVLRIAQWAARKFPRQAFQLLFPVSERDLPGVKMLGPYLWARMRKLETLSGVGNAVSPQRATVEILRVDGKIIETDDTFVQDLIRQTRECAEGWSRGIRKGSFVRVLMGETRMLCGEVLNVRNGIADVRVKMRLRTLRISVPVRALLHLGMDEKEYHYTGERA